MFVVMVFSGIYVVPLVYILNYMRFEKKIKML